MANELSDVWCHLSLLPNDLDAMSAIRLSFPTQAPPANQRTNEVYMTAHKDDRQIFSNQTGQLPITSNKDPSYVIIFYIFNENYVKSVPVKNRSKEELLCTYKLSYAFLACRGYQSRLHQMDNETSKDVEDFIAGKQTKLQCIPPGIHQKKTEREM